MTHIKAERDIIFHIEERRDDGFYRATCYERQQYNTSEWYPSPWAAIIEIASLFNDDCEQEQQQQQDRAALVRWRHQVGRKRA